MSPLLPLLFALSAAADPRLDAKTGLCADLPLHWKSTDGVFQSGFDSLELMQIPGGFNEAKRSARLVAGLIDEAAKPLETEVLGGHRALVVQGETGFRSRRWAYTAAAIDHTEGSLLLVAQGDWDWAETAANLKRCAEPTTPSWRLRAPDGLAVLRNLGDAATWFDADQTAMMLMTLVSEDDMASMEGLPEDLGPPVPVKLGRWRGVEVEGTNPAGQRIGALELSHREQRVTFVLMTEPHSLVSWKDMRRAVRSFRVAPQATPAPRVPPTR